jgi:hypothetical protein
VPTLAVQREATCAIYGRVALLTPPQGHRDDRVPNGRIVALWGGPGFHIVHYPLRHGTLFNIVAVFRRSAHSERGDVSAYCTVANAILKMSRAVVPEG